MDDETQAKLICGLIVIVIVGFIVLQMMIPDGNFVMIALAPTIILFISGLVIYFVATESQGASHRTASISKYSYLILLILIIGFIAFPFVLSRTWGNTNHETVIVITVSDDGKYVAGGTTGQTGYVSGLYFYDGGSGNKLWENSFPTSYIRISADGKFLIAGYESVYLLDATDGNKLSNYDLNNVRVIKALISSDGSYYSILCSNGSLFLFSKSLGTPVWIYSSSFINDIDISSDGTIIVAGLKNNNVYLFNSTSNIPMWSYAANDTINNVSISSNGKYFIAGSENNHAYFFDKTKSSPLWIYNLSYPVIYVKVSNDALKAVAIAENIIDSYSYFSFYVIEPLSTNSYSRVTLPSQVDFRHFSFDDNLVYFVDARMLSHSGTRRVAGGREVYGYNSGEIEVYKIENNDIISHYVWNTPQYPLCVEISGNGKDVVYCGHTNEIYKNYGMYHFDVDYPIYTGLAMLLIYPTLGIIPAIAVLIGKLPTGAKRKSRKSKKSKEKLEDYSVGKTWIPSQGVERISVGPGGKCPTCGDPVPSGNRVCWNCFTEFK